MSKLHPPNASGAGTCLWRIDTVEEKLSGPALAFGIWSTSANLPRNQPMFLHRSVLRGSGRFNATWCVPKGRLTFTAGLQVNRFPRNNSPEMKRTIRLRITESYRENPEELCAK